MGNVIAFMVMVLVWMVPLALVFYLFSTLRVIVEGLQSINAHLARISAQLAARDRDQV